jgi:acyl-CoA thioesterase FadM
MHQLQLSVQIFDTDCYGVMWHGAYHKWLEMGRVALMKACHIPAAPPPACGQPMATSPNALTADEAADDTMPAYLYPVSQQHLTYVRPARLNDDLTLTTQVSLEGCRLVFTQVFSNTQTGKTVVEAITTCVAVDPVSWKPVRRLPPLLLHALEHPSTGRSYAIVGRDG